MLPLIQKKPLENSFTQKLLIFNLVLLKPRFCLIHSEIPILKIILHAQLLGRYEKPPYLFKQQRLRKRIHPFLMTQIVIRSCWGSFPSARPLQALRARLCSCHSLTPHSCLSCSGGLEMRSAELIEVWQGKSQTLELRTQGMSYHATSRDGDVRWF